MTEDKKKNRTAAQEAARRLVEKAKRDAKEKGDTPAHRALADLAKERRLTREQLYRGVDF